MNENADLFALMYFILCIACCMCIVSTELDWQVPMEWKGSLPPSREPTFNVTIHDYLLLSAMLL